MIKIGSHMSFSAPDYLVSASNASIANGANSMMIYLGAPQSTRRVDIEKYKLEEYKELKNKIDIENIVVHAPYIVNPANLEKAPFAVEFLTKEIERMNYLGIKYLVLHPGAHTKWTREQGIERLVKSLKELLAKTKNVVILLETMAGKGTELGTTFEELKDIIDAVDSDRMGICFDTCHVWDAGYDIKDYPKLKDELKATGILDLIKVFHINDSKNILAAHKDRHENIDQGEIGLEALKKFIHDPDFAKHVKVLETPHVDGKPIYKHEISMLLNK